MSFVNYQTKHIDCRVVYWGPRALGLRENIVHIFVKTSSQAPPAAMSEAEAATIVNHVPMSLGEIRGFRTTVNLYSAPPGDDNESTRRKVLDGIDGLVFVASSDPALEGANIESWERLRMELATLGIALDKLPRVVQLDQRNHPRALTVDAVRTALGIADEPIVEAIANQGIGVFDTLKIVSKAVLAELKRGA